MNAETQSLLQRLRIAVPNSDFLSKAEDILEDLKNQEDAKEAIEPVLRIIEENPAVDFGAPGPLVHFVEGFFRKGYEIELMRSVKRCPTQHTLWMLNRIINGITQSERKDFLDLLQLTGERRDTTEDVRQEALRFLRLHTK